MIYDISADAIERYRQRRRLDQLAADVEELLQAEPVQVREDAALISQEVAGAQPSETQSQMQAWLSQVPSVARRSLRRSRDNTGLTVPPNWQLDDPIQLGNLLPQRVPRFKAGDRVPNASSWVLVQMLGSGGFGEVWLGSHSFLNEKRAFKFCLDPYAREGLLQHEGEVVKLVMQASQVVKGTTHGIVPLLDAYLDEDAPWLAYEYIDGGDLSAVVRELQIVSMEQRADYALKTLEQLARVIGQLHRLPHPITHRDLKPANVLLRRTQGGYGLRVTDFGISHVAACSPVQHATVSTPSMSLGETYRGAHTPIYASPQQKRGSKADVRDDVHALGVIAYQMILGDLAAERPAGKWKRRVEDAKLAADVLDLLESCWDDDPQQRPRDAMELAERLTNRSHEAPPQQQQRSSIDVETENVDLETIYQRAEAYFGGKGVVSDAKRAFALSQQAATHGHAKASNLLGQMLRGGLGVSQDHCEAVKWFRIAAQSGVADAQYNLGHAYFIGEGVVRDTVEAVSWYRKSAKQGYAKAQYKLGCAYASGDGVVRDDVEARKWLQKAADQGNVDAHRWLSMLDPVYAPEQDEPSKGNSSWPELVNQLISNPNCPTPKQAALLLQSGFSQAKIVSMSRAQAAAICRKLTRNRD